MKKILENKYTMYVTLDRTLKKWEAVWIVIVAFNAAVDLFRNNLKLIDDQRKKQAEKTKGITIDKDIAKKDMIEQTVSVAGFILSYASNIKNNTLRVAASVSRSELENERDTTVPDHCETILQMTTGIETALAAYGFTTDYRDDAEEAITVYRNLMGAPQNAKVDKSTAIETMEGLFAETDKLVRENMKGMMEQFVTKNPSFYSDFEKSIVIIDLGVRHKPTGGDDDVTGDDGTVGVVEPPVG